MAAIGGLLGFLVCYHGNIFDTLVFAYKTYVILFSYGLNGPFGH